MRIIDLKITDFLEAYKVQIELVKKVYEGLFENTLLITEHAPTITLGRKAKADNILRSEEYLHSIGIRVYRTDRGGDATYHGPGQIVAYPIFKLENEARDIHRFLHFLEETGSHFLRQYGVETKPRPGLRGLWVEGKKIGSMGIGIKKWVTYHGLSINLNVGLLPFSFIKACGIEKVKITSLQELLGRKIDIYEAKYRLASSFKEIPLLAEAACKT